MMKISNMMFSKMRLRKQYIHLHLINRCEMCYLLYLYQFANSVVYGLN